MHTHTHLIKTGPTWHCVVGRNFGSFVTHGKYLLVLFIFYKKRVRVP